MGCGGDRSDTAVSLSPPPAGRPAAAAVHTMLWTDEDPRQGERTETTATFLTRRPVRVDEDRVDRLLFEGPDGRTLAVLVAPSAGRLVGLRTGDSYRLTGLVAVTEGNTEGVAAVGRGVAAAARRLGLGGTFAVLDEATAVEATARDGANRPPGEPV